MLLLGLSNLVYAQTVQTTPNLLTSGTNHTWYGVTTGAIPTGCGSNGSGGCAGGPTPLYDPASNTVYFSYNANASVGQTMAINQALAGVGAGVKINGYNYSYDVRNMNLDDRQPGTDAFTVSQLLRGPANSVLLSSNQYYNTKFEWKTVTGTKTATTPYNIADTSYIQFGVTGGDNGYWGGYFGPQVRNVNMSLNYTVDPCATNPAYSPSCPNYNTVTTSSNLFTGVTGPQAYAINQALSNAGAGAMIHGFNYGYDYNVAGRSCAVWDIFGFCITGFNYSDAGVSTVITDNNNATLFSESNVHNGGDNGTSGTYSKQFRFGSSRPISTLGGFAMAPWTSGNASITNMYSNAVYTPDPCVADPLSSQSCPGYAAAYLTQQCNANPLYNSACPGYAAAMFTQQCNANQLSDPACPGYASAYLTYQCSINPLYSTTCSGYQQAYHDQQCSLDPLYATTCTGYAAAYKTQQCTANPLYATDCPGYDVAYKSQQCTANPLYATDCPGYDQAYLNAQCIRDSLYSRECAGYATAYAIKNLVKFSDSTVSSSVNQSLSDTAATKANDPANTVVPTTTASTTVSSDGTVSTGVSTTGDTNVDKAISSKPASTSGSAPAAPVQLVAPAPAQAQAPQKQEEKKAEGKPESGGPQQQAQNDRQGGDSKPAAPTARQELQAKREAAAKTEAVERGKNLANEMGKAADMESQKQIQNVVIQAMGFTPGFDTYSKAMMTDVVGYKPFSIYNGQKNIDNRANLRMFGGTDRVHNEMVESQYNRGN